MLSNGKHGRLPRAMPLSKAQTFTCGIFGVCSPFLLSPRTPPFKVPNNSQDFSASNILLIQQGDRTDEPGGRSQPSSSCSDTPNFYSLNAITPCSSADRSAPISPSNSDRVLCREVWTDIELAKQSPAADFSKLLPVVELSPQQSIHNLLVKIRKGQCSKSGLEALQKFMKDSKVDNVRDLEGEVARALIALLTSSTIEQCYKHTEPYQEAFAAVVRLACCEAVLEMCVSSEMLVVLEWMLNRGSLDARANCAILVQKVACNEKLEASIRDRPSIMDGVLRLMQKRDQPNATKLATRALLALCLAKENRCGAVRAGAVCAIVKILPGAKVGTAEKALATLELLGTTSEGRAAMSENDLLVPILVNTILKVSDRATEYAAGGLCAICTPDTLPIQEKAVQAGAQTRLLLLLQSQCTPRAKRKALQLLKVLHKFWDQDPRNVESGQTEAIHY